MSDTRILYVCTNCADAYPEGCGHYDRNDLAVMPNGDWLCDGCFDDLPLWEREKPGSEDELLSFRDFPHPPEYVAKAEEPQ